MRGTLTMTGWEPTTSRLFPPLAFLHSGLDAGPEPILATEKIKASTGQWRGFLRLSSNPGYHAHLQDREGERVGLYDLIFRRGPPIRDVAALSDFIDEQSAFLIQKGIYEFSRARAGHYSKVLFSEQTFLDAAEQSRWRAYPLGLAMVGEMVGGVLRPQAEQERSATSEALATIVLSVFDRYSVPTAIDEEAWRNARTDLAHRLALLESYPRKRVMDIPEPFVERYFALMPIHKKLRASDFPTIKNYLKVVLINMHDDLTRRMDAEAMAGRLRGAAR